MCVHATALHLGTYTFKGTDPLEMVSVASGPLVGRAQLLPREACKGKGSKVADREGVANAADAPLPDVLPGLRDAFVYAAASYAAASAAADAAADAARRGGSAQGARRRDEGAAAAAAGAAVEYAAWLSKELTHRRRALGIPPSPTAGARQAHGGR